MIDNNAVIERRLGQIEQDVATLKVLLVEQHKAAMEMLRCHETSLYGNGHPGLRVEVDRLTQEHKRRDWQGKAIWGAIAAATASAVATAAVAFK